MQSLGVNGWIKEGLIFLILLAVIAFSTVVIIVPFANAGGRVTVKTVENPAQGQTAGSNGTKIFKDTGMIGLEAEYDDPDKGKSEGDETGAGGWKWWVTGPGENGSAGNATYDSNNTAMDSYGTFSRATAGDYTIYARKNIGQSPDNKNPDDNIKIKVVEGELTLNANADELQVDKKVKLTADAKENPPGDITFTFYDGPKSPNNPAIDSVTTDGKTASIDYPVTLPMTAGAHRFWVTVDHSGIDVPEGGDGQGTPFEDEIEDNEVDVRWERVEIKYPHGDPTVSATNWGDKDTDEANVSNELTFSAAASPTLSVACEAYSSSDDTLLRWTIEDIGGLKATWNPHVDGDVNTGKGASSTASFTGLPAKNTDFGAKKITLKMQDSSLEDVTTVEVFFPRDASNHPGDQANSPNWFYYWSQTQAYVGNVKYNSAVTPGQTAWDAPDYTPYVGDIASRTYQTASVGVNANNTLKGIDFFAYVVRHEWKHHENNVLWWGPQGYDELLDADSDGIPDDVETTLGPAMGGWYDDAFDTHPQDGINNDVERATVFMQQAWNIGSANGQDWGSPGMQHQVNDDAHN